MARARELADQLADGPPLVFAAIKEIAARNRCTCPIQQAFDLVTKRKLQDGGHALFAARTSWKVPAPLPRSASRSWKGR